MNEPNYPTQPNSKHEFIPFRPTQYDLKEMMERSEIFYATMQSRRSVRSFSSESFPLEILTKAIAAASTAPSGAHKQPWTFCVVSAPDTKSEIRLMAEKEEYDSYHGRMNAEWLNDLKPLGTDHHKPFLETAPYLVVVFKKPYDIVDGKKRQNYYVNESVGIAVGMLLSALHYSGLCALTHTPSPMQFLGKILQRPENERPYLLIPVGYPAPNAMVPKIQRKPLDEVMVLS